MTEPIRGKIAKILSTTRIAINRGSEHGVQSGMRFRIVTPLIEIPDPDSQQEVLGSMYFTKTIVRILTVYERFSVAINDATSPMLSFPRVRSIVKPLKLGSPPLERSDEINVGDEVNQILPRSEPSEDASVTPEDTKNEKLSDL